MVSSSLRCLCLRLVLVAAVASFACTASVSRAECNGRGLRYDFEEGDLFPTGGCQCYQCFEGVECERETENCVIETEVAEATLWQEWFVRHNEEIKVCWRWGCFLSELSLVVFLACRLIFKLTR